MPDQAYRIIVGLEIHAELLTESKVWCGCSTKFGAEPNTQVCPICLGLPGTLPVLNARAVEYAVKAGLALGCTISEHSVFDRKQYFYPDLPKAYQISQYDQPLCVEGAVEFNLGNTLRRVGIIRVHLEEEAGKLVHSGDSLRGSHYSLIDYNRGGLALIEIVTKPDLRSGEEARVFLEHLRTTLRYTGVSDCKMQEGSLRCDANVNLAISDHGTEVRTPIVEIKNLNSFRAVERAINYEVQRQYAEYCDGSLKLGRTGKITAGWSDAEGRTYVQRQKEEANDYRYFPDPDLVPVELAHEQVEEWRSQLPELPAARAARFVTQYDLPPYDAGVLTADRGVADYFEAVVATSGDAKMASNWVMGELLRLLKATGDEVEEALAAICVSPEMLGSLLAMVKAGRINTNTAKEVFAEMYRTGKSAETIVHERGLEQINDTDALGNLVAEVLAQNAKVVNDIKSGKQSAMGFLVGQVMKATKGKANPQMVNELIRTQLGSSDGR